MLLGVVVFTGAGIGGGGGGAALMLPTVTLLLVGFALALVLGVVVSAFTDGTDGAESGKPAGPLTEVVLALVDTAAGGDSVGTTAGAAPSPLPGPPLTAR